MTSAQSPGAVSTERVAASGPSPRPGRPSCACAAASAPAPVWHVKGTHLQPSRLALGPEPVGPVPCPALGPEPVSPVPNPHASDACRLPQSRWRWRRSPPSPLCAPTVHMLLARVRTQWHRTGPWFSPFVDLPFLPLTRPPSLTLGPPRLLLPLRPPPHRALPAPPPPPGRDPLLWHPLPAHCHAARAAGSRAPGPQLQAPCTGHAAGVQRGCRHRAESARAAPRFRPTPLAVLGRGLTPREDMRSMFVSAACAVLYSQAVGRAKNLSRPIS